MSEFEALLLSAAIEAPVAWLIVRFEAGHAAAPVVPRWRRRSPPPAPIHSCGPP